MKFTIDRSALIKTLGHVQNVVERRNTIPILGNVLISAEDGAVKFAATDLDLEITESVSADIGSGGSATAPAHTLYEIVRKLPDGAEVELALESGDPRVQLKAGRSQFSLPSLSPSDFPVLSAEGLTHSFQIEAKDLARLIDKTRFAISTEETRYYLNGIHLHAQTAEGAALLRAVATDGHRLALAEMALPEGAADMPAVIVPRKTVAEIRRLVDDADEPVEVSVSEAKIQFKIGQAVLTSKLIDGSFPDYERVIPRDNDKTLSLENKVFADAVDRVATISVEKSRSIKLTTADDLLTLAVNNPESGAATEELMVTYGHEELTIGFNARYLLDVTSQIEGDTIDLILQDSASPALVKDSADAHALYVLMPLRV